jgi:DNA-binding response OmpR family regulator
MEILQDQSSDEPFYTDDRLFVHLKQRLATLDGEKLMLTRKEYLLLALLVQHTGEVVPKAILYMQIWGYVPGVRTRTLDVHIGRLRKKMGLEGRRIETIFGMGYSFRALQDGQSALVNRGKQIGSQTRQPAVLE